MWYSVLTLVLIGCADQKSIADIDSVDGTSDSGVIGTVEDSDDQLIGDSNVFLEDPTEELDATLSNEENWDTGGSGSDYDGYSGILVQQQSSVIEVIHFGLMLPCDWDSNAINVGYYTENIAEPYIAAFSVDYGPEGDCSSNLTYSIDLHPLGTDFSPGLHVFNAANEQVIVELQSF